MKQFIGLSSFSHLYTSEGELLTAEGLGKFMDRLRGHEGDAVRNEHGFSDEAFKSFIESFSSPSTVVFHGWINQDNAIRSTLVDRIPQPLGNINRILDHHLFNQFKEFVSPFLSDVIISNYIQDEVNSSLFSLLELLDDDHRIITEAVIFKNIKTQLDNLNSVYTKFKGEQELIEHVKPLCASNYIFCVNQLSKASYAEKLNYVDVILKAIKSPACTTRLANWIIKQLELLELNKEHEHKLTDLRKELQGGTLKVQNGGSVNFRLNWKSTIYTLSLLGIIAVAITLMFWDPAKYELTTVPKHASSFKEFSQDERVEIDSLLKELRAKRLEQDFPHDSLNPYQYSSDYYMAMRKSFNNVNLEDLYLDYYKDGILKDAGHGSDCNDSISETYQHRKNISQLSSKNGTIRTYLKNESNYSIIFYVAKNKSNAPVYAAYIPSKVGVELKLDEGDVLFAVAGKQVSKFSPPDNVDQVELPSFDFHQHFCDTDYNYLESINNGYVVIGGRTEAKILISGSFNDYYQVVDVSHILQKY